jgi:hypothetical protein
MASTTRKTSTTSKTSKSNGNTTTTIRKLDTGGRPKGKGKGGTVTQHGVTTTGYQRGCRCEECKAAMADYTARRAAERKAAKDEATTAKAAKAAKAKANREAKKTAAAA